MTLDRGVADMTRITPRRSLMERWKSLVALTVVGALAAGPAWAQSTPSSSDKGTTGTSGSMQKDKAATGGSMSGGSSAGMDKADKAGAKSARGKEEVKAVQQALKDKGHDPGTVDGVMGPKTKQALKEFQKKEGLKESGRLDSETRAKLDMKTSAAGAPGATASSGQDASKSSSPSASPSTGGQDATKKQ
jgi:peptidoglycan hydrolase-like protein with peptidoglycan-binding domain